MSNFGKDYLTEKGRHRLENYVWQYVLAFETFTYDALNKSTPIIHTFLAAELEELVAAGILTVADEVRVGSTNYLWGGTYTLVSEQKKLLEQKLEYLRSLEEKPKEPA